MSAWEPPLNQPLSLSSCPPQCQQHSRPRRLPPYSSRAKVQSCKPWPPSLSDPRVRSRVHSQRWRRCPNAHLRPPSLVVFAAAAVPRYPRCLQLPPPPYPPPPCGLLRANNVQMTPLHMSVIRVFFIFFLYVLTLDPAERPDSVPEERVIAALLLHCLFDRISADHQEPQLLPV